MQIINLSHQVCEAIAFNKKGFKPKLSFLKVL